MIPAEAIERVIDDLETKKERATKLIAITECKGMNLSSLVGDAVSLQYTIQELRKVLSDYGRSK